VGLRPLDYFVQACCVVVPSTATLRIVLLEADWTPAVNEQAEGRCRRIGQRDAVLAQYLVVPGSIDIAVMRAVAAKMEMISAVVEENSHASR
jgi:SNF2 family DNA or RNA helicase